MIALLAVSIIVSIILVIGAIILGMAITALNICDTIIQRMYHGQKDFYSISLYALWGHLFSIYTIFCRKMTISP